MMQSKLKYGLWFFTVGVLISLVVSMVTVVRLGKVIAAPFNLVMFYITLFLAFVIFFGSIAFLTGVLIGTFARTRL